MKKEKYVIILLSFLLMAPLVIAQGSFIESFEDFVNRTISVIASIVGPILGPEGSAFGEFLFFKLLLFFLMFAIVFIALRRAEIFDENRAAHAIVTIIVSIFIVRYMGNGIINAIILPYPALGASIGIFVPLVIYSVFVNKVVNMGAIGRRAAWFAYGIIFLVLWRTDAFTNLGQANWIYWIALGYVILSLLFDSKIHQYFEMGRYDEPRINSIKVSIADLQDRADKVRKYDPKLAEQYDRKIKRLARKL